MRKIELQLVSIIRNLVMKKIVKTEWN